MTTNALPNIGPRGCQRRRRMGWVWLGIGIALVAVLTARDAPLTWYGSAAIPFFMAALGYFQASAQTCVFFAAVDQRDMDTGAERIADREELARVKRQANRVWLKSIATSVALTAIAILIGMRTG